MKQNNSKAVKKSMKVRERVKKILKLGHPVG